MGSRQPVSEFTRRQRDRQERWRGARPMGRWTTDDGRDLPLRWGIRADLARETLYPPIAEDLLAHFARADIAWHEEHNDRYGKRPVGPSPNLMDSQVFCLNFWEGLAAVGDEALLAALRVLVPEAVAIERPPRPCARARVDRSGQLPRRARLPAASGGVRDERGSAQNATVGPSLAELMRDPFDQLLRLTLLAEAMQAASELGCRSVSVGWAAPRANTEIWETITVPALAGLGPAVPEAWQRALVLPYRFRWASYEELFAAAARFPETEDWARWMAERYGLGTVEGP